MDRTPPFIYGLLSMCPPQNRAVFNVPRITHFSLPEPRSVSFLSPFPCFNVSTPFGDAFVAAQWLAKMLFTFSAHGALSRVYIRRIFSVR